MLGTRLHGPSWWRTFSSGRRGGGGGERMEAPATPRRKAKAGTGWGKLQSSLTKPTVAAEAKIRTRRKEEEEAAAALKSKKKKVKKKQAGAESPRSVASSSAWLDPEPAAHEAQAAVHGLTIDNQHLREQLNHAKKELIRLPALEEDSEELRAELNQLQAQLRVWEDQRRGWELERHDLLGQLAGHGSAGDATHHAELASRLEDTEIKLARAEEVARDETTRAERAAQELGALRERSIETERKLTALGHAHQEALARSASSIEEAGRDAKQRVAASELAAREQLDQAERASRQRVLTLEANVAEAEAKVARMQRQEKEHVEQLEKAERASRQRVLMLEANVAEAEAKAARMQRQVKEHIEQLEQAERASRQQMLALEANVTEAEAKAARMQRQAAEEASAKHGLMDQLHKLRSETNLLEDELRKVRSQRNELPTLCQHCGLPWDGSEGASAASMAAAAAARQRAASREEPVIAAAFGPERLAGIERAVALLREEHSKELETLGQAVSNAKQRAAEAGAQCVELEHEIVRVLELKELAEVNAARALEAMAETVRVAEERAVEAARRADMTVVSARKSASGCTRTNTVGLLVAAEWWSSGTTFRTQEYKLTSRDR